ncbi:TBC domain-containing protein [Cyphellophora attinorum]|uniref:TBC domain-containing protein n=1 Tax=Cyphellophora attinorum TaxID=1664694 RepID=A0A0N1HH44_9EURO|nr:TBC domain-containing protein [Phialophora attinorum]KPI45720.1 TBC domain-containing protein [Phialophora attinorum]
MAGPRHPNRARSWNFAMEELSEEARIISENLEFYALKERTNEAVPSPRPQKIQLPPIQKGNLDFMPFSKEKEAVLSRTRPSWLPPKDPREEQKHLKQYQQMMAASLEAEKKKQSQAQIECGQSDTDREALARIWAYYCDEETNLNEIDHVLRGKVWKRSIGNQLGLTAKSYEKALERAKQIESTAEKTMSDSERASYRCFRDIERDAETAFPELHMFQQKGPMWQDLVNVCKAYACYRSDIGYVYGLQLVAALLLLQLPTAADAFVVLANALQRNLPLSFLSGDLAATARTFSHAVSMLAIKFSRLHEYLFGSMEQGGLGLSPEQVFEPMFRTLFTNGLDVDRLCRVWDIWAFEGDKVLVHTAVALLGALQPQLFEISGNVDLRRRNIQEMLAWGPFNRTRPGEYWDLAHIAEQSFVEEVQIAGKLDYRGK